MNNIVYRYTIKKGGNAPIHETFSMYEIETGYVSKWCVENNARFSDVSKDLCTYWIDKNGVVLFEHDKYITHGDKEDVYTVFFKNGSFCGGVSYDESVLLGWDVGYDSWDDEAECVIDNSWIGEKVEKVGTIYDVSN